VRTDVVFESQGSECAGWLYRPQGEGPLPLVVMAHGFSATRELRLDAYAERFEAAGLGVLLFDYRHFGASSGEPRQLLDIGRQHRDYHAAIAYGRDLDWVDRSRIALFGSSFSGGHVLAVAAQDGQVAAVVSQCPFTDGIATLGALGARNALRLTIAGLRDQLGAIFGRLPHYIPAVGPPGSSGVMTTPDSEPGMRAIVPAQTKWENRVAARIALRVALYRPGRAARKLACPVLVCVCEQDSLAPAEVAAKYAASAPRGEVKRYPVGHFEIYVEPTWSDAVAAQTEFLAGHLLGAAGAGRAPAAEATATQG
jgi:pimeloyl-ACP methyl ester carboxylesterase